VYSNSRGIPYEIVTYNNIGEFVEKVIRVYNNQYQVITESNYKYDETWKLLSQSNYQYDVNDRLIDRQYQQFNDNGSRSEHSTYEYDNMKNINKIVDLFTLFNKNNRIKETTTFTSRDSLVTTSIKTFVYDYNEEGYPIKVETSSSSNENVSVRFNTIICD
jgi:predicted nucleic-acid-binding Zn-ribbon protein